MSWFIRRSFGFLGGLTPCESVCGTRRRGSTILPPSSKVRAGRFPCRPALFDPDHLSRVTKCGFTKTVPQLAEVLSERSYTERPLAVYPLGPATAVGGMIFTQKGRLHLSHLVGASWRDTLSGSPVRDEVVLINSMQGLRYFGHWLSDDVSAFEAFRGDARVLSLPLPPGAMSALMQTCSTRTGSNLRSFAPET